MTGTGKAKEDSDIEKIVMILTGAGMIVVASTCFKEIPLLGTVFLIPGDSIFQAKVADPIVRYALFLIGGLLAAYGLQQTILGFRNALKKNRDTVIPGKPASRRKPWRKPWELA